MAKLSAWMAMIAAAAIVISVMLRATRFEFAAFGPLIAAALLGIGAWRTLRAMSGGLRLLCGAWGVAAGLAWYAPSYNFPDVVPAMLAIVAPVLVSAAGLALVVLYKEPPKKAPA